MRCLLFNGNIDDVEVELVRKPQRTPGHVLYFFSKHIGFQLFNPSISYVDTKGIVFVYDKFAHITLYEMLRTISRKLLDLYSPEDTDMQVYGLYSETDTSFSIRCSFPTMYGRYLVSQFEGDATASKHFRVPFRRTVYSKVVIDIVSIWQRGKKTGFNLNLKEVTLP